MEVVILILLVFGLPVVSGDKSACNRSEPDPFFGNFACFEAQSGQTCDSYLNNKSLGFIFFLMDSSECCGIASHRNLPGLLDLTSADYILYILYDSLPVLILVPLILFFNINLASGPGHSLVFTFQVLVAVFHSAGIGGFQPYFYLLYPSPCGYKSPLDMFVLGPLVFFNEPLFLFWQSQQPITLTHYALGYVKILIAGVMVVLYLFLATCSQCPVQCCRSCWAQLRRSVRNWRERHFPQRPVFTGVCSVAILMYGSLVEVSFRLLFRCELAEAVCSQCNNFESICYWYYYTASSQPLCWGSPDHYPYFIPAWVFIGVAVLLSLPFFYHPGVPALVSYLTRGRVQLPRLHRVRPIFDLFQGVYKPRMQFFVGLHLLYRVGIWSTVSFASNDTKLYALHCLWLVILAVHSLFQPFESRRHNYLEGLLMVNFALVAVSLNKSTFAQPTGSDISSTTLIANFITLTLANLPLLCVVVYYLYKFFRWCWGTVRRRSGYAEIQAQGDEDEMEESYQGERWEPPNNANFP